MSKLSALQTAQMYYRDARVLQIYDGTNKVQKILISRELTAGIRECRFARDSPILHGNRESVS